MELKELSQKLAELQKQLKELEEFEQEITKRRIASDMADDYRENEGAKLVMEQHDMWYIRKVELKKEILKVKQQLHSPVSKT